ncbi:MAG: hypothetical protein H6562_20235 [Lewinellaceae bacterium]|nr:hypothetical protein [Lewinellaceae bacterium]
MADLTARCFNFNVGATDMADDAAAISTWVLPTGGPDGPLLVSIHPGCYRLADLTARWFQLSRLGATDMADLTARWFQFILGCYTADLTARWFQFILGVTRRT